VERDLTPIRVALGLLALGMILLAWWSRPPAPIYDFGYGRFALRQVDGAWFHVFEGPYAGDDLEIGKLGLAGRLRQRFGAPYDYRLTVLRRHGNAVIPTTLRAYRPIPVPPFNLPFALAATISGLLGALIAIRRPSVATLAFLITAAGTANAFTVAYNLAPLPDWLFVPLSIFMLVFLYDLPGLALASFAVRFPPEDRAPWRKGARKIVDGFVLLSLAVFASVVLFLPLRATLAMLVTDWIIPVSTTLCVMVIALASFLTSRGEQRSRITAVLVGVVAYEVSYIVQSVTTGDVYVAAAIAGDLILSVTVAYAALRYRMLDIGFVLNRTAVYAITSGIVVLVFGALEWIVEQVVNRENHIEGVAAELGVALVLVALFRFLHGKVDSIVDDLLFRARHAQEAALQRFAHAAAFYEAEDPLVTDALTALTSAAQLTGAALYLESDDDSYYCRHSTLEHAPARLDCDDPAAVELRADGRTISLHDTKSALAGERAYPLLVAAHLTGFIVTGPTQTGEQIAPDIDDAVTALTIALGRALDAVEKRALRESAQNAREEAQNAKLAAARCELEAASAQREAAAASREADALRALLARVQGGVG
jgi:hypothetical protein